MQYKEEIAYCTIEEADQRIIRHVINCAKNYFQNIVICTGDTDILVLLILVLPLIQKIKSCNIICKLGIGDILRYYNVVTLFLVSITTANYSSLMHGCRIMKKKRV